MKNKEFQAKELFSRYGIPVSKSIICNNVDETLRAYQQLTHPKAAMIAQAIDAGKKGRIVKIVHSADEVKEQAKILFATRINGFPVTKILVGEVLNIFSEYYLSLVADWKAKSALLMLSPEGGNNIREIERKYPGKIYRFTIDNAWGITDQLAKQAASTLFNNEELAHQIVHIIRQAYKLFIENDTCLVEINSLALTSGGKLIAADARVDTNHSVLYLHPDMGLISNANEEDKIEAEARMKGFGYIHFDGEIACVVNGQGLIMNTMEMIKHSGANSANYLDIGSCIHPDKIAEAMQFLCKDRKTKAILFNIFGGLICCEEVARNFLIAFRNIQTELPVVFLLRGTNEREGRQILRDGPFQVADNMEHAIRMTVEKTNPYYF